MLKPLPSSRWNFTAAAHLLNRAGFGGPPEEIEKRVTAGLEGAVSMLVDYDRIPDPTPDPMWAKPDPERMERLRASRSASAEERRQVQREEQRTQRERVLELRGWWLHRMASGPRPLQEKMALFWHGHFATSVAKVRDAYYMWRQNELFRRLALGDWRQLLTEVARDPAMLIWLDQAQSRKQHPNENFARELMELFSLGEGHYTEKDITEAARALTGWSLDRQGQKFVYRANQHDDGVKTVLGSSGNLAAEDVIGRIVAQPQAAVLITARIWNFFAGQAPSPVLNEELAAAFRRSGNRFKPLLRTIFLSEDFYDPAVVGQQVKSPVQWLVGTVRLLESELPPAGICAGLMRNLGQELFAPPNVKGWDGGLAWITTNTLLARYNQAAVLLAGSAPMGGKDRKGAKARRARNRRTGGVDVGKILSEQERSDKQALLASLERRLLQATLKEKQRETLTSYLESKGELDASEIRGAIRLIMSTPEYQLT